MRSFHSCSKKACLSLLANAQYLMITLFIHSLSGISLISFNLLNIYLKFISLFKVLGQISSYALCIQAKISGLETQKSNAHLPFGMLSRSSFDLEKGSSSELLLFFLSLSAIDRWRQWSTWPYEI